MNHPLIITQKNEFLDQVSNYKIGLLQKIRRFQGRFVCKFPFFDRLRHFYAKNDRKNLVSNYKISIILKIRGFLDQLKYQSLYNDRTPHIYKKNDK